MPPSICTQPLSASSVLLVWMPSFSEVRLKVPSRMQTRVVAAQGMADRGDVVGAAGDHKVVVAGDAVFIVAGCGECTAAVEDQIVLTEQRRVRVVIVLGIEGTVCQGVFAVRGQVTFTLSALRTRIGLLSEQVIDTPSSTSCTWSVSPRRR